MKTDKDSLFTYQFNLDVIRNFQQLASNPNGVNTSIISRQTIKTQLIPNDVNKMKHISLETIDYFFSEQGEIKKKYVIQDPDGNYLSKIFNIDATDNADKCRRFYLDTVRLGQRKIPLWEKIIISALIYEAATMTVVKYTKNHNAYYVKHLKSLPENYNFDQLLKISKTKKNVANKLRKMNLRLKTPKSYQLNETSKNQITTYKHNIMVARFKNSYCFALLMCAAGIICTPIAFVIDALVLGFSCLGSPYKPFGLTERSVHTFFTGSSNYRSAPETRAQDIRRPAMLQV